MTTDRKRDHGAIILTVAVFLTLLLGFAAIAMECGRWYLIRAELSKSVDAGALEGAKNISNPYVSATQVAKDFAAENFKAGAFGTPPAGAGSAVFSAAFVGTNKIKVDGSASAQALLAKIVGFDQIPVSASGAAAMRKVEIMLILDRSLSMDGTPMTKLKEAANAFVTYFTATQATDKMGLISFSTSVKVDRAMSTNYVTNMKTSINGLNVDYATNIEDALDQADGPSGFSNQAGIPVEDRVQQIAVLFTDGYPTAFRDSFRNNNVVYDASVWSGSLCETSSGNVEAFLRRPDTGAPINPTVPTYPTGNGVAATTQWLCFGAYPIAGYGPTANIPRDKLGAYVCQTSGTMALDQAKALKDKGVTVFVIGLKNPEINETLLGKIASAPDMFYVAPTANDLQTLFTLVAKQIKLRLVA